MSQKSNSSSFTHFVEGIEHKLQITFTGDVLPQKFSGFVVCSCIYRTHVVKEGIINFPENEKVSLEYLNRGVII